MPFDDKQTQAIETKNKDILVSAGAGSGKTSVMIERIVQNIIAGEVNVTELLVVTFTNASASEMRLRLEKALNDKLASNTLDEAQSKRLREQVELLGQSDICTLHKFYQTIIQKYFYTVDLDPSFVIGDESETAVLRARVLEELFKDCEAKKDPNFTLLAHTFDDKRNFEKIKTYIYKIYLFLTNLSSIDEFKARTDSAYSTDLNNNKFCQIINENTIEMFDYYGKVLKNLKREAEMAGCEDLIGYIVELMDIVSNIKADNNFEKNQFAIFNLPRPRDLRLKAKSPEEDELKEKFKAIKDNYKKSLEKLQKSVYLSADLGKIAQDLQESKNVLDAMLALVEKFSKRYLKIKKDRNMLDFADMEHYAYKILQQDEVSRDVRSRYKQIFVDEFQDVNDIQEDIITSIHKSRDLFLVGDIKQSIYGFRGTNPMIFLNKQRTFGDTHNDENITIDLNNNYRTDQKILDLVNWVFGKLMTKQLGDIDYLPDNEMVSGAYYERNNQALPPINIEIIKKEKEEKEKIACSGVYRVSSAPIAKDEEDNLARSEGAVIAQKISELMTTQKQIYDAKSKTYRDIKFGDITLLCRGRSTAVSKIVDTVAEYGIPVAPISKDSAFEQYEVQVLFSYLYLVNNPYDDVKLTTFLISPLVGLNEQDLADIRIYANKKTSTENSQDEVSPRACARACVNYYDCVFLYLENKNVLADKLRKAMSLIEEGAEKLQNDTIYNLLNYICNKTNYFAFISSLDDGQNRLKNVRGYINNFIGKKYNTDLSEYLSSVEQAQDAPVITPEYTVGADVVRVETMHESKGLEYPIVFLVDMGHGFNTDSMKGDFLLHSSLGVGMMKYDSILRTKTPTISHTAIKIAMKNKDLAESLRLLYVAMTRAKNHLFITGCLKIDNLDATQSAYALKSKNNFLALILCAFGQDYVESIKNGYLGVRFPLGVDNELITTIYDPISENEQDDTKAHEIGILDNIDTKIMDILSNNCNYTYKYAESIHKALKNTVTALNREYDDIESVNITPKNFNITENRPLSAITTEQGIAYHKAMQLIDFDLPDAKAVELFLITKMTPHEMELIDVNKIFSAIVNIRPLLVGARVYREQQFLMLENYNSLVTNSKLNDEILVQGVIDLIIVKNNEIYLLDYKTSGSHNVEKTAQNYIMQLNCYEKAIEGALKSRVSKKFLYFFLQERLILIDN